MGLHDELWLCNRLKEHGGMHVHAGATDYAIRMGRVRKIIADAGLADKPLGRSKTTGHPMTFREAFHRVYAEPL